MSNRRRKSGRTLERVIASIERVLAGAQGVTIESPKFLKDRLTGEDREHDVLLTIKSSHHTLTVSIECRDRSRKITVNDVEGFWAKCQHTGVDQGVLVSPKGYSKSALRKSEQLGLRCLMLAQVPTFNWLLAPGLSTRTRRVLHTGWVFFPETDFDPKPATFTVLSASGDPVQPQALTAAALKEFRRIPDADFEPGRGEKKILFEKPDVCIRNDDTGEVRPVIRVVATVDYEVEDSIVPFTLSSYTAHDGTLITDVAAADVDFGVVKGKLMIVYNQATGGQIVLVPDRYGA